MHHNQSTIAIIISSTVYMLILFLLFMSRSLPAQTPADCRQSLETAQTQYHDGRFDEAIQLINDCLASGLKDVALQTQAYKQLTLAYLAQDHQAQAKRSVIKLLDVSPDYSPNSEQDLPQFISLVETVKAEIRRAAAKKQAEEAARLAAETQQNPPVTTPVKNSGASSSKRWYYIGGGAAAAGLLAAVILAGGNGSTGNPTDPPGNFPGAPGRP